MKGKFGYFVFFAFVLFVFFFFLFIMKTKAQPSPRPYLAYVVVPTATEANPLDSTPVSPQAAAKPATDPANRPQDDPGLISYKPIPRLPYGYTQPVDAERASKTPDGWNDAPPTVAYIHPPDVSEQTAYYVSYYAPQKEGPSYHGPGYLVQQALRPGAPTPRYYAC